MKNCRCNKCKHKFISRAQIKNIKCPECGSNESLSIYETVTMDIGQPAFCGNTSNPYDDKEFRDYVNQMHWMTAGGKY